MNAGVNPQGIKRKNLEKENNGPQGSDKSWTGNHSTKIMRAMDSNPSIAKSLSDRRKRISVPSSNHLNDRPPVCRCVEITPFICDACFEDAVKILDESNIQTVSPSQKEHSLDHSKVNPTGDDSISLISDDLMFLKDKPVEFQPLSGDWSPVNYDNEDDMEYYDCFTLRSDAFDSRSPSYSISAVEDIGVLGQNDKVYVSMPRNTPDEVKNSEQPGEKDGIIQGSYHDSFLKYIQSRNEPFTSNDCDHTNQKITKLEAISNTPLAGSKEPNNKNA
ncbi:MAG: hypothetical protein ACRDDF_01765, partial [Aeromonas sp.]